MITSVSQVVRNLKAGICLHAHRYSFPAADPDLLGTFYPELIGCMLEMQDPSDDDYTDGGAPETVAPIV